MNIQGIDLAKLKKDAVIVWQNDPIITGISQKYDFELEIDKSDVYFDLIKSIISQQLSVKVAKVISSRFLSLFEDSYPHPYILLDTSVEDLRKIGLSIQKAAYIKNIAIHFIENQLIEASWHQMTDQEISKELCKIKGVGEWTAHMVLMFSLNRLDIFPIGDLAIRNAMIRHYGVEEKVKRRLYQQLTEIADHWRPFRSIACHYLWASIDPK